MENYKYTFGQRLTERQKRSDNFRWYKEHIDHAIGVYDDRLFPEFGEDGGYRNDMRRERDMDINYDLYDGKIRKENFKYIYSPFNVEGDKPADFNNKDIISKRINAIDGIERQRQFAYKIVAVNPEATSRREQEEFSRMREYVVAQIMEPIQQQLEQEAAQQAEGAQMKLAQMQESGASQEEIQAAQQEVKAAQQQMQEQMQQRMEAMTPEEVRKYMKRDHQDPADVLGSQIMEYIRKDQDLKEKWNLMNKDFACVGTAVAFVGERYGKAVIERVNPKRFRFQRSTTSPYIEDGEWCSYERWLNPSELAMEFGDELSNKEIEELCAGTAEADWDYMSTYGDRDRETFSAIGVRCVHVQWKDVKRIGFLTYLSPEGFPEETVVADDYTLDLENGDISLEWQWVVCVYEGFRLGGDKYLRMREVPGQFSDLGNINNREKCKLSYIGICENVSLIDRMKSYQFLYSIVWYRMEMMMARDKGRGVGMNASLIPDELGMDKFLDIADNLGIFFFAGNTQEGDKAAPMNIGEALKDIDRSMGSDIEKYRLLAEFIDLKCGESVGINQQIIGQIQQHEAVSNAQMAVNNGANVLEGHFGLFAHFKTATLQALIECGKSVFMKYQPECVQYVLDDFSIEMLRPDYELLDQSTYGVFPSDSGKTNQLLDQIVQLVQPALQNQSVEMSDVVKIMKSESIQEAEELLMVAEENRRKREDEVQQQQSQQAQQLQQMKEEFEMKRIEAESKAKMEQIRLKGEYDMKMKEMDLQRQAILALGFDTDKDRNENAVPDVYEYLKMMLEQKKSDQKDREVDQKERKLELEARELEHKRDVDKEKLELERKKITMQKKSK